jgi:hypothetical protein
VGGAGAGVGAAGRRFGDRCPFGGGDAVASSASPASSPPLSPPAVPPRAGARARLLGGGPDGGGDLLDGGSLLHIRRAHGLRRREVEGQPQLVRVGDETRSILALANRASPSPVGDPRRSAAGRPSPSPAEDARRSAAGRSCPSRVAGRGGGRWGSTSGSRGGAGRRLAYPLDPPESKGEGGRRHFGGVLQDDRCREKNGICLLHPGLGAGGLTDFCIFQWTH